MVRARARVRGRRPGGERARAWTTPRPSSSEISARPGRRRHRGAPAPGDQARRRCRRRPGSPTTARRSSGSRWSGPRWRRIPRWRRFVNSATQPRVLVAIGVVALLLGVGAIFASQQLLSDDEGPSGPHVGPGRSRRRHRRRPQRHLGGGPRRQGRLGHRGGRLRPRRRDQHGRPATRRPSSCTPTSRSQRRRRSRGDIGVKEVEELDRDLR